ncbi:OmpA family protein [Candidatus Electrothrix sp.]|uniref:OmpA family protein n=1 Tax=Candidatus Electrothrix sp. TaxID=2170559 RepID=UPI0040566C54
MHIFSRLLPAVFSTVLLFGCAAQNIEPPVENKDLFVLLPDQDGNVGKITISNRAGSTTLSKANESAQVSSTHVPTRTKILPKEEVQNKFQDTLQAIPGTADQYILYFTPGTSDLTEKCRNKLPLILERIKERLPCEISIIGHTDTQGSNEYNLALALARAIHVKNKLLTIGAPRELLEVSSHGETDPMIPTKDNVAEPKNRRVELFIR